MPIIGNGYAMKAGGGAKKKLEGKPSSFLKANAYLRKTEAFMGRPLLM